MARDGYLIMDSDLHMMEPDDLWARYLDEPYRQNPPRFFGAHQAKLADSKDDKGNADNIMGMEIQGLAIPAHAGQSAATASTGELRRRSRARHPPAQKLTVAAAADLNFAMQEMARQYRAAMVSFTMATGTAFSSSERLNSRPETRGMPIVAK